MNEVKTETPTYNGLEVAVIGLAGRFPGARNIAEFWQNLKAGVESIHFFSDEELVENGVDPSLLKNAAYVRAHGFLEDNDCFDPAFFGYTPTEAAAMDPQVRIFHQCVWQALEDAGYDPFSYPGLIGLYGGASPHFNWEALCLLSGKTASLGDFAASQLVDKDFLCVRVSHKLNLKGPTLTLYTACSTSLVAIHLAVQAVQNGECSLALGGGVTVLQLKKAGYVYQEGMVGSPDGHCRTFDRQSAGTVAANGAGVVVLKRLAEAVEDRDHIYAVVKGSALTNDGSRKVGFTAPGVEGQAEAIRIAHLTAEVSPESIGYVEAHGTATALGDPVEVEGLKLAFNTGKRGFCALGTVKSNMGHLDSAAGVTGFIKTVLALKNRQIPPSLHFMSSNADIDFEDSPFYVNRRLKQWENGSQPRRAGVSSFGLGGTNAHVVLEEAPETAPRQGTADCPCLILLSAKTEAALKRMSLGLADYFRQHPHIPLADAAYTLQVGRAPFACRQFLLCASADELVRALSSGNAPALRRRQVQETDRPVVFMFSGQGSQYVNMGLELYQQEKTFRQEMEHCFEILERRWQYPIREILYPAAPSPLNPGPEERINHVLYSGPVKFAFEYALAKLLIGRGIEPRALIGHSFGEYAAAAVAGVFSPEDALELVVLRGQLMEQTAAGAMMSVALGEEAVKPFLNERISLAAVNSPQLSIVSGERQAVAELEQRLTGRGHECIRINFPRASHSALMQPVTGTFARAVARVGRRKPQIPYISGLSGQWITGDEAVDPAYWSRHLVCTIRFFEGITTLLHQLNPLFLQVSCDRGLPLFVSQHPEITAQNPAFNIVRHPKEEVSDVTYLLNQVGNLWLWGAAVDWHRFHEGQERFRLPLPTYPFERHAFTVERDLPRLGADLLAGGGLPVRKPDMADWLYVPTWIRSRPAPIPRLSAAGHERFAWLLFLDGCGLGQRLAERLRQAGCTVVTAAPGERFDQVGAGDFVIRPTAAGDYDALLSRLSAANGRPLQVVHLWLVTDPGRGSDNAPSLDRGEAMLSRGFYSLFYLVRAWGSRGLKQPLSIQAVSSHMQEVVGGDLLVPEKAALLGPVKVIPREYPTVTCRSIDLAWPPEGEVDTVVSQLLAECTADPDDTVVAYRGRHRWQQSFKPLRLEHENGAGEAALLKRQGVYWITGGLGGIGLVLAGHLAETVGARLVLSGRSPLPERSGWDQWLSQHPADEPTALKIRKLRELERQGADILTARADAADPQQMRRVLDMALNRFGTIDGVIHCAGLADGALVAARTPEMTADILAPKVQGTLVLNDLLAEAAPDFLILCSSANAILPALGQLGHCGANAFLDAFAWYKHSQGGLTTIAINWNAWREVGQAAAAIRQAADTAQLDALLNEEGVGLFSRILSDPLPQVVVSTFDFNAKLAGLKREITAEPVETSVVPPAQTQLPRPQLSTPYLAPRDPLEQNLADIWQQLFGFDKVGVKDNFFELGGDSVKGMMFVNRYKKLLAEIVHVTVVFNAPTIEELAGYFGEHYPEAVARIRGEQPAAQSQLSAGVDDETIARFRRQLPSLSAGGQPGKREKNPSTIFILSASRSGSTLLRVMLAGHPQLFAPPELALLANHTLAENPGGHQGCIRAIMELKGVEVDEATALMREYEDRAMGVQQFYQLLQEWIGPGRRLVDKTPGYALDLNTLRQAEVYFDDPLYIHLVRHPYGMIRSFEEAKLDLFFDRDLLKSLSLSRRQLAELSWIVSNQNILEFFKEVPPSRRFRLRFEDLVARPRQAVEEICRFLKLPLHDGMVQPYREKKRRMSDGIHTGGIMLGDVKFHQHRQIDASAADTWKQVYRQEFLGETAYRLAASFGYPRPNPCNTIPPAEEREYYELTPAQRRLYVIQQMETSDTAYNMSRFIPLQSPDRGRLEQTFRQLIHRHESLRTSFQMVDGQPVQRVFRQVDFRLEYDDGHDSEPTDIMGRFVRPFDLSAPPLLRVGMVTGERDVLLVDMHHIISDRISHSVLARDFQRLYRGEDCHKLKLQYKDYAVWQNSEERQRAIEEQAEYWLKVFAGDMPRLRLPLDFPRPAVRSFAGSSLRFSLDREMAAALKSLTVRQGVSLQILMLAIFYVLLFRLSHQSDIVVGTSVNGRGHADLEEILGVFVNILALRNFPTREKPFDDFLKEVRQNSLQAYDNQDYQFDDLVKKLRPLCKDHDPGRSPLFDVMFEMMQVDADAEVEADADAEAAYDASTAKFDLDWMGIESGGGIHFSVSYCTELFKPETVRFMIDDYIRLVQAVLDDPQAPIGQLLESTAGEALPPPEEVEFDF
jgi:phthiocerol/phenolphthiocerol synthesis type-I polyketide synthase E